MNLYHYTCEHGRSVLRRRGTLMPQWQPLLGVRLSWASDLDVPDADALGLSSLTLDCDRTACRYRITDVDCFVPWLQWWPGRADPRAVSLLTMPPRQPRHWWITTLPAQVELAP